MIFDKPLANPDEIALDDLVRHRTRAETIDRGVRIARLLRTDLALESEDHAGFLMGNRVECIELALAAILAGIWMTPINSHLQAEEIAYVVADSGCRVLFTDPEHQQAACRSAAPRVVLVGDELEGLLARTSAGAFPLDGPAGGTMVYTSGTTGRPKGVKRARQPTLGATLAAIGTGGNTFGVDGSGPHLVTGPLYHAGPLLFALYDFLNGAPLVIMPRWDDVQVLRLIQERGIHHTHLVPTMFVRLLRLPDDVRAGFHPGPLHLVLHGAAPIPPSIKHRMIDWWGPILVEYWGATESGTCTLADSAEWLAHPGTVGRATGNFEVFAVDEQGQPLPPGEVGTLYCRHKSLPEPFSYHNAPEKMADAYLARGTFTLGDIGRVEADGYVYLSDRKSNMIITGGVNVYPAEVEEVLQQHPAVGDVAVFGIPNDEWGEEIKAAVELMNGFEASAELESDILQFARERLAHYKVPRSIDFEPELPRHATGKLHTRLLRDRYWKDVGRSI
jgi:long-chain acyl-CoA synthetase